MQNYLILLQVTLPYVIGGIAVSIVSVLIVNYLSKEVDYENLGND